MTAPTLSTGQPSTLRTWVDLSTTVFGADSPATKFLLDKMAEQGEDEAVLAPETQLLQALMALHLGEV